MVEVVPFTFEKNLFDCAAECGEVGREQPTSVIGVLAIPEVLVGRKDRISRSRRVPDVDVTGSFTAGACMRINRRGLLDAIGDSDVSTTPEIEGFLSASQPPSGGVRRLGRDLAFVVAIPQLSMLDFFPG